MALQRNGSTKNLSPQQLVDCNLENRGWCVGFGGVVVLCVNKLHGGWIAVVVMIHRCRNVWIDGATK